MQAGRDNFVVRGGNAQDMRHLTIFNTATYVVKTMIFFDRCMGDPQPERLSKWACSIPHVARRHK